MNVLPLIAQNGVHHKVFEGEGNHNAMWDMNISPEGKPYFSLGSELVNANFAKLYEYDLEKDEFIHLFNVEDVILHSDRAIRPSKIHTSINFLPNGHLLMSTHTTDRSPNHPYWMPEAYYADPHEGFQGSNIIEYDPESKKAISHGIPIPYESIYGGIYVERTNTFYFLGFFKGHLYSYDLTTHKTKDFGQATDYGVFRLHEGPDGKLYFAGRSGYLMRFNIDTEEIEELGHRFEVKDNRIARLDYALNLDNRILLFPVLGDYVYIFDTSNDTMENLGNWGTDLLPENPIVDRACIFGPALDSKNVLWYTVTVFLPVDNHIATLHRWDFLNGKKPEVLGTIGSPKTGRICTSVSEAYIRDDVYYIADTNHADDLPGFVTIDLKEFEPHMYENAGYSDDPYIEMKTQKYRDFDNYNDGMNKFKSENPFFVKPVSFDFYRLWTKIGRKYSKIKSIYLTADGVCGYCGDQHADYFFTVKNGEMSFKTVDTMNVEDLKLIKTRHGHFIGDRIEKLCVSGRQYKSVVSASAQIADGKIIVGTQDGVLGIIEKDRIFRLGRVGLTGPVRDLVATPDGKTVFGVSGDKDELGMLFRYTEESGVEELGILALSDGSDGFACSSEPCCCDISDDGKTIAVGVNDAMGTAYILNF